jgi:hypothetical protein
MSSQVIPATCSAEIVISYIIKNRTSVTIEQQLTNHLDGIPRPKRLEQVQNLLLATSEADDLVIEVAAKVWTYVMANKLWEPKYSSLEAFKESIAYDVSIHDMLKRYGALDKRQKAYARKILVNWESLPFDALPAELHPPRFSRTLLEFLYKISKICSLDKAIVLLKEQVRRRIAMAGPLSYSKMNTHITVIDLRKIHEDLKGDRGKESQKSEIRNRYA